MDFLLEQMFKRDWKSDLEKSHDKGLIDVAEKLVDPNARSQVYCAIKDGTYQIMPPREQLIPKDNGDFRTVYICSDIDRVVLTIINNLLFELCPEMIHKNCKSYQKGLSTQKTVKEVVRNIQNMKSNTIGLKVDLTKYFDSVPICFIDEMFDKVEEKLGKSKVIDMLRRFYHQDLCFDLNGNLVQHYFSLGQGVATASWLANAILYNIDEEISKMNVYYVRYSDDLLLIGKDWQKAEVRLRELLAEKELVLNPKKVEVLKKDKFFKFLGFSIRGNEISLSKDRIKTFQKEIENRTIKSNFSYQKAINQVMKYLYGDMRDNGYSWSTACLTTINVKEDIQTMNNFVMDCLRAVKTGKKKLYGLGYKPNKKAGVITAGRGQNVTSNRNKTDKIIPDYISLMKARNSMLISNDCFNALRRSV
jgi:hypothetical protein